MHTHVKELFSEHVAVDMSLTLHYNTMFVLGMSSCPVLTAPGHRMDQVHHTTAIARLSHQLSLHWQLLIVRCVHNTELLH